LETLKSENKSKSLLEKQKRVRLLLLSHNPPLHCYSSNFPSLHFHDMQKLEEDLMTVNSQFIAEKANREKFEVNFKELEKKAATDARDQQKAQQQVLDAEEKAVRNSSSQYLCCWLWLTLFCDFQKRSEEDLSSLRQQVTELNEQAETLQAETVRVRKDLEGSISGLRAEKVTLVAKLDSVEGQLNSKDDK